MFELVQFELDYMAQLDNLIHNEKDFSALEKLLHKKYEFIKQLHIQEIEYSKIRIEMRKIDDKYDLDRKSLVR